MDKFELMKDIDNIKAEAESLQRLEIEEDMYVHMWVYLHVFIGVD